MVTNIGWQLLYFHSIYNFQKSVEIMFWFFKKKGKVPSFSFSPLKEITEVSRKIEEPHFGMGIWTFSMVVLKFCKTEFHYFHYTVLILIPLSLEMHGHRQTHRETPTHCCWRFVVHQPLSYLVLSQVGSLYENHLSFWQRPVLFLCKEKISTFIVSLIMPHLSKWN